MNLSLGTAAFFTALVEFALGISVLILWLREGRKYLAYWCAGFLAFGLGSLLISARNKLPDFFTIILANLGTTLSSILLYAGICLFFGQRRSWGPWAVLVLEAAWLFHYTYIAYDTTARVYVYSVAQALIVLCTLWTLFVVGRERAGKSNPEVVIVTLLLLGVHLARIAGTPYFPLPQDFLVSGNFQTLLSFGLMMVHASYALALGNMHASALNADLSAALADAKIKERQKVEVLSYIGHDLRAPLATISGYSELLFSDAKPNQHQLLRTIQRSVKYQMDLIEELLEYGKAELRPLEIQPVTIDLPGLLQDISDHALALCRQQDNQFVFQPSGSSPRYIEIDGKRLQQVLLNLIANAAKFTQNGRVTLFTRFEVEENICTLYFSVSDTGEGIDLSQTTDIFSAFQHTHAAHGGSGLGLFIAQRIVSAMGESLRVASTPGQGSTFSFEFSAPVLDGSIFEWTDVLQKNKKTSFPALREKIVIQKNGMPKSEALDELAELALYGQFTDIERWIARHAQNPNYDPLVVHLGALLERFEFSEIRVLALRAQGKA